MPDHRSDGPKHTDVHGDALVGCARPPLCRPHPWPIDLRQGRTATTPSVPSYVITRVPVKAGPGGGIAEGAGRHDRKGPPGPDPMLTMSKNGRESLQRSMAGLAMPVSRNDGGNCAPRRQDWFRRCGLLATGRLPAKSSLCRRKSDTERSRGTSHNCRSVRPATYPVSHDLPAAARGT